MDNNPRFISGSQALRKGAQLWVLSEPKYSTWNHRIDWYLCFQIRRSRLKKVEPSSEQAQALLKKYHLYSFKWRYSQYCPILIESSQYLPNLWTVELPYHREWINKVYDIWHSLNQPTLRIFAPQLVKKQEVEGKWKGSGNIAIQYIFDKVPA